MIDFKRLLAAGVTMLALSALPAQAADKVSFGTDWLAQAEHGGFYQAVADGTYAKYGLDVTIVQGGPQAANRALLIAGKIDFYMGGVLSSLDSVKAGIPMVTVASMFQKDPQVLMTHPDAGYANFADLAKAQKIIMGKDVLVTKFEWMKKNFPGFKDEQYVPYTFNPAPFIADDKAVQQGYVTSEPYAVQQQGGFEPHVFLFADAGYNAYSETIETSNKLVHDNPDLVQRFVDASIIGWYNYLYGDNKAANELIKKDNPEMTDGQLDFSIAKMKEYGIVDSGDSKQKGIGCLTDARYKDFFNQLVSIGLYDASLDYSKAIDTQFVCKGVGMDLAK
ncbi:MAG TPA: ABC transporter substrate-binding protein [Devosiaceae bacterium]|jgi:NitT/TauT family transport system substrate-binding protein